MKASAQPGFCALCGCGRTASLVGKAKLSFWKSSNLPSQQKLHAYTALGSSESLSTDVGVDLEAFMYTLYFCDTSSKTLAALRCIVDVPHETNFRRVITAYTRNIRASTQEDKFPGNGI
jgi:hypothetical protein